MRVALLDANALIAMVWPAHEHHVAAHRWFGRGAAAGWATCPLTELAFVRILSNPAFSSDALSVRDAMQLLEKILKHPGHEFWSADLGVATALRRDLPPLKGHRQATDAYLLALAGRKKGVLATFDAALARDAGRTAALEVIPA